MRKRPQAQMGKGYDKSNGKTNARRRFHPPRMDPVRQLAINTAKLSLDNARDNRFLKAGLTHTAMGDNPYNPVFNKAVQTTLASRGTDQTRAAVDIWKKLNRELTLMKDFSSEVKDDIEILRQILAATDLDSKVIACKAMVTYDQTQLKINVWVHGMPQAEWALIRVLVSLGLEVIHGPAPPLFAERATRESLAEFLALNEY
eukprot:TRINITY_DN42571_c0_g1_i1.p4 TRINITY_DN42571_c0_g1~~TRINITY_DN42571_c0_g1_i1.p4  ORF type:complete len:202 (-),score=33.21 TRINITY_DN42571_c0_g1_i1:107-712(-)